MNCGNLRLRLVLGMALALGTIGCTDTNKSPATVPLLDVSHVPVPDPTDPAEAAADDKGVRQLQTMLPQFTLSNCRLNDAIDYFRRSTGANVVVRYDVLKAGGIDVNAPLNLQLKDIPAPWALEQTLLVASPDKKLDYEIYDGIITISTMDDLNRDVVTRVYDVRELVNRLLESPSKPAGTRYLLPAPGDAEPRRTTRDMTFEIMKLISDEAAPDTWRTNGGTAGMITEINGRLSITNSRLAQSQVSSLLKEIAE